MEKEKAINIFIKMLNWRLKVNYNNDMWWLICDGESKKIVQILEDNEYSIAMQDDCDVEDNGWVYALVPLSLFNKTNRPSEKDLLKAIIVKDIDLGFNLSYDQWLLNTCEFESEIKYERK
jgi:hypothetical protein